MTTPKIEFSIRSGRPVVNGAFVDLPGIVTDTLIVEEGLLVSIQSDEPMPRNVFLISPSGEILWQIEEAYFHLKDRGRNFTSLFRSWDGKVLAGCSVGVDFEVDMKTGKIKPWVDPKVPNKRPW